MAEGLGTSTSSGTAEQQRRQAAQLYAAIDAARRLSLSQRTVLKSMLRRADADFRVACTQQEIARRAGVSPPTVTQALRALDGLGVYRRTSAGGQRAWLLQPARLMALARDDAPHAYPRSTQPPASQQQRPTSSRSHRSESEPPPPKPKHLLD